MKPEPLTPAILELLNEFLADQEAEWQRRLLFAKEHNDKIDNSQWMALYMTPLEVDRGLTGFRDWLEEKTND